MPRFLACYIGAPSGLRPDEETIQRGMAAWYDWMDRNSDVIVDLGGPLGKTKRVDKSGASDTSNSLTGYVIIEADSHEAAAALFEGHPHFSIFPGDCVEIMPCMPIPGS